MKSSLQGKRIAVYETDAPGLAVNAHEVPVDLVDGHLEGIFERVLVQLCQLPRPEWFFLGPEFLECSLQVILHAADASDVFLRLESK